jgi:hypothetical protein
LSGAESLGADFDDDLAGGFVPSGLAAAAFAGFEEDLVDLVGFALVGSGSTARALGSAGGGGLGFPRGELVGDELRLGAFCPGSWAEEADGGPGGGAGLERWDVDLFVVAERWDLVLVLGSAEGTAAPFFLLVGDPDD